MNRGSGSLVTQATCKRKQQLPTLLALECESCCVRVGMGVQTDATTPTLLQ